MNRYALGLDVGERRIGVALASQIAKLPAPLTTIDRTKTTDVVGDIQRLIQKHDVSVVVIGLPRSLEGNETDQTAYTRAFAKELGERIDAPIVLQDEAGTSLEAETLLKSYQKPYEKGDIDAMAAVLILRDYLAQMTEHIS